MHDLDVILGDMLPLQSKNLTRAHPREQGDGYLSHACAACGPSRCKILPIRTQMPHDDFTVIYSGDIVQVDLLKSILEGSGIQCVLQDEYVGRMRPDFVPGGVKVLVAASEADKARRIVEDFIKGSTT